MEKMMRKDIFVVMMIMMMTSAETHIHPGEDYDDDDGEYDDGKYDDGEYDDGAQTTTTTPLCDDINDIVVMVLFFSLVVLAACYMNTFRYKTEVEVRNQK
ncbi:hypothetical protein Pcinc_004005 [Petrolisthes cinctipes]|uniref:Transmembrane protein n=1 Tax=Petrolisthes cinctipes TaxID=88211 RepID=A0AAE1GHR6_PETCI|nr:hypothetical protein Pcinc_004005 [Petrolisthes cinctipes]